MFRSFDINMITANTSIAVIKSVLSNSAIAEQMAAMAESQHLDQKFNQPMAQSDLATAFRQANGAAFIYLVHKYRIGVVGVMMTAIINACKTDNVKAASQMIYDQINNIDMMLALVDMDLDKLDGIKIIPRRKMQDVLKAIVPKMIDQTPNRKLDYEAIQKKYSDYLPPFGFIGMRDVDRKVIVCFNLETLENFIKKEYNL